MPNYAKTIIALSIVVLIVIFVNVIYLPGRIDDVRGDTEQMVKAGIDKAMAVAAANKSADVPDLSPQVAKLEDALASLESKVAMLESGINERDRIIAELRTRVTTTEQQAANAVASANAALTSARTAPSQPVQAPAAYTPPQQQYIPPPTPFPTAPMPVTPSMTGALSTTVDSWKVEVRRVTLSGDELNVAVTITSLDEDTELVILPKSVAYDQQGREMVYGGAMLGGKAMARHASKARFIQGVPVEMVMKFRNAGSQSATLPSLEICFQRPGPPDLKVAKFRNVPITR